MARKPRMLEDGAAYHVMNQINRKKHLLKYPKYKKKYLEILKRAKDKYKCEIRNFCIMDNHVHLDIRPTLNNLSGSMQWISSMFAREYNKMTGGCGRLWRGRFKSKIIKDEVYEKILFEYISLNPVRVGLSEKLTEFEYSGIYQISRNNFTIIKKPDSEMLEFIDDLLKKSENPDYFDKKSKQNTEFGFYPEKPGRKPVYKDTA